MGMHRLSSTKGTLSNKYLLGTAKLVRSNVIEYCQIVLPVQRIQRGVGMRHYGRGPYVARKFLASLASTLTIANY